MGVIHQPIAIVVNPRMKAAPSRTVRGPYRSIKYPDIGAANIAAMPPALADPARSVLLQPRSSAIGNMKTPRVRDAAALRTNTADPAEKRIAQP
jgi:hypothetical protein